MTNRHLVTYACRLALVLGVLAAAEPLSAQDAPGPKLTGRAAEIHLGGRVQTQFNTTTVEEEPGTELLLRRVRLGAEVKFNDLVSGEVEADFAGNRVSVTDAFVKLSFGPGLRLLAGQAFLPFSLLGTTSSVRILPVERGAVIRGIEALDHFRLISGLDYSERDVGVQLTGEPEDVPLDFEYAAGIFRGPLHAEVGPRDSYQYATRLSVAPLSRVRVGAGWSSRHFARDTISNSDLRRGHAWEIDLEIGSFRPGFHLLGEVAFGDFDPFARTRFLGAQGWLGYRTQPRGRLSALEPVVRASYGTVNDPKAERGGTLLTPGMNLYFGGWNRFMVNYDWWLPKEDGRKEGSFKAQLQLAF